MSVSYSGVRRLLKIARWLAAAGVVCLIAGRLNGDELRSIMGRIQGGWVAAAAACECIRLLTGAVSMRRMLASFGQRSAYVHVLRVNLQAAFFGVVADWVGSMVRWGGMVSQLGVSSSITVAVILWETLLIWIQAYVLNWALLPAVARGAWNISDRQIYMTFLLCAGPLLVAACVLWTWWVRNPPKILTAIERWVPDFAGMRKKIGSWAAGSGEPRSLTAAHWLIPSFFILIQFVCSATILFCFARAVDAPLDWIPALWICAFANMVQSLPAAILGWTFRVGLLAVLLPRLGGGSAEQAVVMGICAGLISLLGAVSGGFEFIFYSRTRIRREATPAP